MRVCLGEDLCRKLARIAPWRHKTGYHVGPDVYYGRHLQEIGWFRILLHDGIIETMDPPSDEGLAYLTRVQLNLETEQ